MLGDKGRVLGWNDHQLATTQPFANVIVRVPLQQEAHTRGDKGPKTLSSGSIESDADRIGWQTFGTPTTGDLTRGDRTDDAIDVTYFKFSLHFLATLNGGSTDL